MINTLVASGTSDDYIAVGIIGLIVVLMFMIE